MKEVRIEKKKLVALLEFNRDDHADIYAKALKKYCEMIRKPLQQALKLAQASKAPKLHKLTRLVEPRDHTKEYDTVLEMLNLSVDDTITLSHSEFRQYVEDDWNWSRAWAASNSLYTESPKFAKYLDEDE